MFNFVIILSMLIHGVAPSGLLLLTLVPIPKKKYVIVVILITINKLQLAIF